MSKQVATIVLALLLAAGVGGAVGAGVALSTDDQPSAQSASPSAGESVSQTESTAAAIYKRAKDAVVEVHTTTSQGTATGSGFVIDKQGHIVTNEHVVDRATKVTVQFSDQSEANATIVGTDASTDIAVLKVDRPASKLTPLSFASTSSLQVGNPVVAIGSPFGLEGTLTTGVISGLGREIKAPNGFTIENAVQTDAALNHGNSGGPVLDMNGRVIGVAAQIESDSGGNVGIGYAVPADTAQRVARQLIQDGNVEHAYLGVSLPDSGAATIEKVSPDTPADAAGLQAGDQVTAVDGKTIDSGDALREAIDAKKPGDKITLTIKRNGNERTVQVTLGQRPASAQ
jgi:putative serine protease PepD